MNSSTTTADRAFGTATGLRDLWESLPAFKYERPAVTKPSRHNQRFRMSEDLTIEIQYEGAEPEWLVPCMERLANMLSLPEDWDSYGAKRIRPTSIVGALNFLLPNIQDLPTPLPDVVAHRNGNVQLEWHIGDVDLEVEVLSEHQYKISYSKGSDEVLAEDLVTRSPDLAVAALREFAICP